MANIALDVERLVACVRCNDDAEDERFYNGKDKVWNGKRLCNFGREVAPRNLQVGGITGNEDDSFRDEEPSSDGACAKEDVHDDGRNGASDNARHDKVTDGVDAHGCKSVHFGIDDHAADVCGKR